jgi:hypothetical protein
MKIAAQWVAGQDDRRHPTDSAPGLLDASLAVRRLVAPHQWKSLIDAPQRIESRQAVRLGWLE